MLAFLSEPWIDAMARAAAQASGPLVEPPLVMQQVVTGSDEGEAAWVITLGAGTIEVAGGRADAATVTFTQDVETAVAVNRGELSAQAAFMTGRLRVGGDVQVLLDRQEALAEVDDIFALVRSQTVYPDQRSNRHEQTGTGDGDGTDNATDIARPEVGGA